MLGFLSVSTVAGLVAVIMFVMFQSRAGFSECLDPSGSDHEIEKLPFQSRAGFSECLDESTIGNVVRVFEFQSRAGFSECLDTPASRSCVPQVVSIPCWVF